MNRTAGEETRKTQDRMLQSREAKKKLDYSEEMKDKFREYFFFKFKKGIREN